MESTAPGAGTTLAIIGILSGLFVFVLGFSTWRRKRIVEDTPTSTIRALAMGRAEIVGLTRPRETLSAPISGRACAYYRYSIEGRRENPEGKKVWTVLESGDSRSSPFYVQDDTGGVKVAPLGAEMFLRRDLYFDEHWDLGRVPRSFDPKKWRHYGGPLRFEEWRIEANDRLYIIGFAQEGRAPGFWEPHQGERVFVGASPDYTSPFLISDRAEGDVRRRYLNEARWSIFGGSVLCVLSLFVLLRLKGTIAAGDFARALSLWSSTIVWMVGCAGCTLLAWGLWSRRRFHAKLHTAKRAYREAFRTLKADAEAMRGFDLDADGHLSTEEWDAARTRIDPQVGAPQTRSQAPAYGIKIAAGIACLAAALCAWFVAQ